MNQIVASLELLQKKENATSARIGPIEMKLQKCFASLIFALTPKLFRMMEPVQAPFLLTMITLSNYHFLTEVKKLLYSHITIRDITSMVKT